MSLATAQIATAKQVVVVEVMVEVVYLAFHWVLFVQRSLEIVGLVKNL